MPRRQKNKERAIVLVRLSALGDVAMAVPVIYDLCMAVPDIKVVFLTRKRFVDLFVNAPANLVVQGVDVEAEYKGAAGMVRLARRLLQKYDIKAFIDLHDVLRTKLLRIYVTLASGVRTKVIDKGRSQKKKLVKMGAECYASSGQPALDSTISRYRKTVASAGLYVAESFVSLFPRVEKADVIFRVGIAPFAAHRGKIYPLEQMKKTVELLAEEKDVEIYLFGAGEKENAILREWADDLSNVVNMASLKKGLAAELELMSRLDVMVSMDSANMHLASIAGTPNVIAVWGATHPAAGFTPLRHDPRNMLGDTLKCRPCSVYGNKPCRYGDYRCFNSITPQSIVKSVLSHKK